MDSQMMDTQPTKAVPSQLEHAPFVRGPVEHDARNAMARAHLLVDAKLHVVWFDDDTNLVLQDTAGELRIDLGCLQARCPAWQRELESMLSTPAMELPRVQASTSPLGTLHVETRGLSNSRNCGGNTLRLVVVRPVVGSFERTRILGVARYYRLSASETRILETICTHGRISDYAAQRQVSIHTARKQLKTMLTKLGAHSQVEAVRLVYRAVLELRQAA